MTTRWAAASLAAAASVALVLGAVSVNAAAPAGQEAAAPAHATTAPADQGAAAWDMVVCADPHAMPLSDRSERGYENRIAAILADELGASLSFDWYPQMEDMINLRLREGHCDIVMGVPDGSEPLLSTITYYSSPYVFVYRSDADFEIASLDDPVLAELRLGLQNPGMPPHEGLLRRGLADNIVAEYSGSRYAPREDPQARLVEAVLAGEIDVGVAWGPPAGYYAGQHPGEVEIVPVTPLIESEPPFASMVVPMTIGVRQGDDALRDRLGVALVERWQEVRQVLAEYGVPVEETSPPALSTSPQADGGTLLVGYVGPGQTGASTVPSALFDVVGDAARAGALLAEDEVASGAANGDGPALDVLYANAPSAGAAERAARRLVATEGVAALVGGLGEGQAGALAAVADELGLPFLDVGSDSIALRRQCLDGTFHVAASGAMYADALIEWYAAAGHRRWFVVREDDEEARLVAEHAAASLTRLGGDGADLVGSAVVAEAQPLYRDELERAAAANADVILLLLNAADQIAFMAQQRNYASDIALAPFPAAVTQSRDYYSAAQRLGRGGGATRLALWEATLTTGAAGDLNQRYSTRYGRPMEPHAWTAYAAVRMLGQALAATGTIEPAVLGEYLRADDTSFELGKGVKLSFRPHSHQLRQPLYLATADPDAAWGVTLGQQVAVAELAAVVPLTGAETASSAELEQALDRLGLQPEQVDCRR